VLVWLFIVAAQLILGQFGGQFFSCFRDGLTGPQWMVVLLSALIVIPTSLCSKFLVFQVLKLGDGEDDLEEVVEEESGVSCVEDRKIFINSYIQGKVLKRVQ